MAEEGALKTMTLTQADIEKLVRQYPVPDSNDLNSHMWAIERMAGFYRMKTPKAPKKQKEMFAQFITALNYSHEIARAYYGLTVKLEKLKDNQDENRTDSQVG